MRALYQPAGPGSSSLGRTLCAFCLALGACGPSADPAARDAAATYRQRPQSFAALFASRSFEPIAVSSDGGALLATSTDGRTLLYDLPRPHPLQISTLAALTAVTLAPRGEFWFAEELAQDGNVRWLRFGLAPSSTPLAVRASPVRFLGWDSRGLELRLAERTGESESLLAIDAATLRTTSLGHYPPHFEIAALSPDGTRVALRHALHPEADEVYLVERQREETRLILPAAGDARFRPLAFSHDSSRLLLLTDEASEVLQLAWLDLATLALQRADPHSPRALNALCEVVGAGLSPDGARIAVERLCAGERDADLLDAATLSLFALPGLPAGVRAVGAMPLPGPSGALYTTSSPRLPRDLLLAAGSATVAVPLSWGLAPGIDWRGLAAPVIEQLQLPDGAKLYAELWFPDRAPEAGVVWIEAGETTDPMPAWNEFHPLLQYFTTHRVAVARLRLRGSEGFGRSFRHAADGRPLAAGLEDIARAIERLISAGVPAARIAGIAEGVWPAALMNSIAHDSSALTRGFAFVSAVTVGADSEPLRALLWPAELGEPARGWWAERLGSPGEAEFERTREFLTAGSAAALAARAPRIPLLALPPGAPDLPAIRRFLEPHLLPAH